MRDEGGGALYRTGAGSLACTPLHQGRDALRVGLEVELELSSAHREERDGGWGPLARERKGESGGRSLADGFDGPAKEEVVLLRRAGPQGLSGI